MSEVRIIAVIGAGTMGRSIAQAAAVGGFRTILEDILPNALRKAEDAIRAELGRAVSTGSVEQREADAALARIEYASNLEDAARDADMVIEAVPDELESKLEIFVLLDKVCRPETMIVSHTQIQSITELASVIYRAPKCIAMWFPKPPQTSVALEIVRGLETSDETATAAVAVAQRMKREPILLRETPGAITARMQALISNEAFKMLGEGLASAEEIDRALQQGLGLPMGPIAEAEQYGLERRLRMMEYLHKTLGETYRPAPLLEQYVKANKRALAVSR
ncbi:3-hydroxybutyryl-CoA dehydrogenase [Candidatus Koribacter versatilis Ellin345]|uniref:3-hydroxybutyryl-CoA dehydrogenase n=1 Tax=Koribacter versatilis (strain Ellin345) TaxID=204669 RepID=Q1IMY8_KORVE|nr:3-hydroxyacyl-CoA dehydrogenase NAD-binding domain-containing protein [Candidatus Koribacter versatilis]ABF41762.1 3-hydroxybutyryl-CoA dehydrogenase [Candidatus Koribacter versatilis Ellin345]